MTSRMEDGFLVFRIAALSPKKEEKIESLTEYEVESVEISIQTSTRVTSSGELLGRHRKIFKINPHMFTCQQDRKSDFVYDVLGKPVGQSPARESRLRLEGAVISGSNKCFMEPCRDSLQVGVHKLADVTIFRFLWEGEMIEEYVVTERQLEVEDMKNHIDIMVRRVAHKIHSDPPGNPPSHGEIRMAMLLAVEQQEKKHQS